MRNGRGESTIPPPFHLLALLHQQVGGSGQTYPTVYIHRTNGSPGTEPYSYMQRTIPNGSPNLIPVTRRSNMHKLIASTGEKATSALTVGSALIPPTNHPASLPYDLNILGCALPFLVDPTSSRKHNR